MSKKVCKHCDHFEPDSTFPGFGSCALTLDFNDGMSDTNLAYGWDYEGYMAGVYVGEQFGCIHWRKQDDQRP